METRIRWSHGMTFVATGETGHAVVMDTKKAVGGHESAPSPKELLLFALGGCTGMDVVSILRKMRVETTSFEVHASAETEEPHPKAFKSFHLEYRFEGQNLPLPSLERAVVLSQDKYCSVSHTLRVGHPMTWSIVVNGETVARGDAESAHAAVVKAESEKAGARG